VAIASVAIVLSVIEPPVILPWLKLDLSEVVVLVAVVVVGYKGAFTVIFLRAVMRPLIKLLIPFFAEDLIQSLIGEMIAVIASFMIIGAYYIVSKMIKTDRKPLIEVIDVNPPKTTLKEVIFVTLGIAFILSIVLTLFNFFIGSPLYISYLGFLFGFSDNIHFTVFGFLNDSGISNLLSNLGLDFEASFKGFFVYNVVSYVPFNIGKAILTSFVFLAIKPRLYKLEL
jgi:riboflavin transporter